MTLSFFLRAGLLLLLFICQPLAAHQLGVDNVLFEEIGDNQYRLSYRASPGMAEALGQPILPARCQMSEESEGAPSGAVGFKFSSTGNPLSAEDSILLPWRRNGVLVSAKWKNGERAHQFFIGSNEGIRIDLSLLKAGSGSLSQTATRYTRLGVEHISLGLDHLLFVAGLLLLVRGARPLLLTITAFTIAHSLTLALSVLGRISLPQEIVDLLVALSIVFLAVENVAARRGQFTVAQRWPWGVSFGFGLVHGLGFAGALNALGLPHEEIPPALLFFNIGVEIGQLAFVAVCLGAAWALLQLKLAIPRRLALAPSYLLGIVASCWLLERTWQLFTGISG